jgi:hypothetical protein
VSIDSNFKIMALVVLLLVVMSGSVVLVFDLLRRELPQPVESWMTFNMHNGDSFQGRIVTPSFVIEAVYGTCAISTDTIAGMTFSGGDPLVVKVWLRNDSGIVRGIMQNQKVIVDVRWGQTLTFPIALIKTIAADAAPGEEITTFSFHPTCAADLPAVLS